MENYEQKYKEALERAKGFYIAPNQDSAIITRLEHLFPELKESEDERIRKWMLSWVSTIGEWPKEFSVTRNEVLAWLEKQKPVEAHCTGIGEEQKHVEWSEEEERMIESIKEDCKGSETEVYEKLDFLESLKSHSNFRIDISQTILRRLIFYVEYYRSHYADTKEAADTLKWLKRMIK